MFNTEPPAGARAVPGGECRASLGEGERVVWGPTVQWIKGRLGSGVGPELKARPALTCCIPIGELTSPGLVFTCVKWG